MLGPLGQPDSYSILTALEIMEQGLSSLSGATPRSSGLICFRFCGAFRTPSGGYS